MRRNKAYSFLQSLWRIGTALTAAIGLPLAAAWPQATRPIPEGPVANAEFRTSYIRLGLRDGEGLLLEPIRRTSAVALIFAHPSGNTFNDPVGAQLAKRGHSTLMVNYRGVSEPDDAYAPAISQGIRYLRTLPGVRKVVIVGHSGGGHLAAMYQNVAENGPAACSGPEKIYPCRKQMVAALERPDGIILLDPTLGAFHAMSSLDPAYSGTSRERSLDMFSAVNGYDPAGKRATYSVEFVRRFHAQQARRGARLINDARARLKAIDEGRGLFSDDEPFVVPGMGVTSSGARLYQPDVSLLSRTHAPQLILKADGREVRAVVRTVRPPTGEQTVSLLGSLQHMTQNTTVRRFLASSAIKIAPSFIINEDTISGVDWRSAFSSTPGNAEGIAKPALVMTMSCHYLVVPGEIVYDHLASHDKTLVAVEGATHLFTPCEPQYRDTVARTFDFVDAWLRKTGRF